ncbi:MAG: molybdopterin-dependent oxidoreductase [Vulcanimicrobiaceae bacterium]
MTQGAKMPSQAVDDVALTVDGVALRVPKGTLLVEAVKRVGQEIPVYCYHTKLGPAGLCRVCLVEIEGMPKLQIGCNTVVADGMVVHTNSERAGTGRSTILELLLVNHPLDCPICDKGGECDLQDFSMAYGRRSSSLIDPKTCKPKGVDLGPTIVLDEERCIVCQRCVRFDEIIARENQLVLKDRGHKDIVATATGDPYQHHFTGNVTEICPVGALTSKTYRFKSRPWDLMRTETSCTQCSVGCRQFADVRYGTLLRTMLVEGDDAVSDGWLCDRGRYNIGYVNSEQRLTQPLLKRDGTFVQIGWDDAFLIWARELRKALAERGPQSIGAIGGGRLTSEEAYLLQHVFRALGVRNVDWRAGRQRQASPGKRTAGIAQIESAEAIVVLGGAPAELAPVFDLRLRRVLAHQARAIRGEDPDQALRALGPNVRRVAVVWDGVDVGAAAALMAALGDRYECSAYVLGEQSNARGAEAMGVLPMFGPGYTALEAVGRSTDEMIATACEGHMAVLSFFGVNPWLHHPAGVAVAQALERTPFVVTSELFMTETAAHSTLVLPAKAAFERSGTMLNLGGEMLSVEASLRAPEGVLCEMEMLIALAQQCDVALLSEQELQARVAAAAMAVPAFTLGDVRFASQAAPAAPPSKGLRVSVASHIFAGGGTIGHDERLQALRPTPQVRLSPADAQALDLVAGDIVDLQSEGAQLAGLAVRVLAEIAPGTAVVLDGLPEAPANALTPDATIQVMNVRRHRSTVEA